MHFIGQPHAFDGLRVFIQEKCFQLNELKKYKKTMITFTKYGIIIVLICRGITAYLALFLLKDSFLLFICFGGLSSIHFLIF